MMYETKNLNQNTIEMANKHINNLTMPSWALGDLLDIGVKLSGIQGVFPPKVGQKRIYILTGILNITNCFFLVVPGPRPKLIPDSWGRAQIPGQGPKCPRRI